MDNFQFIAKIGQGNFASVWKVRRILDQKSYAIKVFRLNQKNRKTYHSALNQIRLLSSLTHQNILSYKQSFVDHQNQTLCLVTQLATKGDVQSRIKQYVYKKRRYTQSQLWSCLGQLANGLSFLKKNKIIHRDIKPANILVFNNNSTNLYKIGDFNISKILNFDLTKTKAGTPYYCSPQIWMNHTYTYSTDIYSLGCLIYEMASLKVLYPSQSLHELQSHVKEGHVPDMPKRYSSQLNDLVKQCLGYIPSSRPSAQTIVEICKSKIQRLQKVQNSKQVILMSTILPQINLHQLKLPFSRYTLHNDKQQSIETADTKQKKVGRSVSLMKKKIKKNFQPNFYQ